MTSDDRVANIDLSRRAAAAGLVAIGADMVTITPVAAQSAVTTGAASVAAAKFAAFANKRIGLVTNHTGRVGAQHLVDLMVASPGIRLTAILAPEHGFRGKAEAGAKVASDRDPTTGIPIYSLYGATKAPTTAMLRDVDMLVFDIQDIGARFYTYISTMGLAMQAAARAKIPFVVLDRPNPIGGVDVSGFVLDSKLRSFVGQYPIPIVHGMSVGELARMIKGEGWLPDVETVNLQVVACTGWTRGMRWPSTRLPWVATSPNIPTYESALVYPGIGMVGENQVNEGRGTPSPFSQFGAPWLDAPRIAAGLTSARLPGVRFSAVRYTPISIQDVAINPRFVNQDIAGVRLHVTDANSYRPLEVGMHAIALLAAQAKAVNAPFLPEKLGMFHAIAGTTRLQGMVTRGTSGTDIIASWKDEVTQFVESRRRYLIY